MGFAHLFRTEDALIAFRARFSIPQDVYIKFCPGGNIENDRIPTAVFLPFLSILKGEVTFLMDPILLKTLSFYGLSPDQCLPNFYRVVNSVIRLNNLYDLRLNHHEINFMYSICGGLKTCNYLKIHDPTMRLISCLSDSNRNSGRGGGGVRKSDR